MFASVDKSAETEFVLPVKYSELVPSTKRIVREQYVKKQNGRCCYCNNKLTEDPPKKILELKIHPELFPSKFFTWPVHLHHNHDTDLTVGAVHAWCNSVLWEYEDE